MTGHNLKIIWRSLMKGKAYSLINIIGLATAMAVALLISLWIYDEVSYNKAFANHKLLAQVRLNQSNHGEMTTEESMAVPVGHALKSNYPADFEKVSFVSYNNDHLLAIGDKKIIASGVMVQQDFPQMFSLDMTEGSNKNFNDPTTIIISLSLANSLFGKEEPTGKVLKLEKEKQVAIQKLVLREEKYRSLLETAPDSMIIVNEKGFIQLINAETEKMFGFKGDELIGKM